MPTELASNLEFVDQHCHGVVDEVLNRSRFAALLSEGGVAMHAEIDPAETPVGLAVRSLCAPLLDLDPHVPFDTYLSRRNQLADANQRLLRGAHNRCLLIDTGYTAAPVLDPPAMSELGAIPTAEIVRIESVAEEVHNRFGPADFVEAFPQELRRRLIDAVALKSIVAYRAGFDLDPRTPIGMDVRNALGAWRSGHRLDDPILLRHCLHVAIEMAADEDKPLQLHTGFGDADIEMWRSDPTRFTPWLHQAPSATRFCFLHCWPFHRQAAFLAAVFPSVYFDTGELDTHAALGYRSILAEAMEVAPFGKLLYSSDAFALAELYLIASVQFRQALSDVLMGWWRRGLCTPQDAIRIVDMIGSTNARQLYRLPADDGLGPP